MTTDRILDRDEAMRRLLVLLAKGEEETEAFAELFFELRRMHDVDLDEINAATTRELLRRETKH